MTAKEFVTNDELQATRKRFLVIQIFRYTKSYIF
jgi:hypothetical protein